MLIVLMFHQVVPHMHGKTDTRRLTQFAHFLQDLQQHYHFTTPGQPLSSGINICLTFDDAYFDFYHYLYPLFTSYQIPAVLGIVTDLVQESANVPVYQRLGVNYPQGMAPQQQKHHPLCTWKEMRTMVASGFIIPASHSASHPDLNQLTLAELDHEAMQSKNILAQQLNCSIHTFIYPYGKGNRFVQQQIARHYTYIMRIGSAVNMIQSWEEPSLIYRMNADFWWQRNRNIRAHRLIPAIIKYYLNRWRGR